MTVLQEPVQVPTPGRTGSGRRRSQAPRPGPAPPASSGPFLRPRQARSARAAPGGGSRRPFLGGGALRQLSGPHCGSACPPGFPRPPPAPHGPPRRPFGLPWAGAGRPPPSPCGRHGAAPLPRSSPGRPVEPFSLTSAPLSPFETCSAPG